MAGKSPIEWTEQTWNPIVGCSIVSPGCTNCYAMKMAKRIEAMGTVSHYDGMTKDVKGTSVWTGKLAQAPDNILLAPLKRKKPTTYFVNSMGDLFHEDCPDEWIDKIFAVMALSPQHTFQVLTKRAERMRDYLDDDGDSYSRVSDEALSKLHLSHQPDGRFIGDGDGGIEGLNKWPLPNVWLGVSTERQQEYDERWKHLANTPAAVRFISYEPALGPLQIQSMALVLDHPEKMFPDWVICGGESGLGARPMNPDWARSLRDQCAAAGVAFFFKQWGEFAPRDSFSDAKPDSHVYRVGKKAAGRHLDGVLHDDAMPKADERGRG